MSWLFVLIGVVVTTALFGLGWLFLRFLQAFSNPIGPHCLNCEKPTLHITKTGKWQGRLPDGSATGGVFYLAVCKTCGAQHRSLHGKWERVTPEEFSAAGVP